MLICQYKENNQSIIVIYLQRKNAKIKQNAKWKYQKTRKCRAKSMVFMTKSNGVFEKQL